MCGIAGAYGVENASRIVSQMLKALQHRGQEAAGIVSSDGSKLYAVKGSGLADEVFNHVDFAAALPGRSAIGHLRYATSGDSGSKESIQPFTAELRQNRWFALVHNGNLTNHLPLRERLQDGGAIFRSHSDSEIFLHLRARAMAMDLPAQLRESFAAIEGAYALLGLSLDAFYAAVDPQGFRPLVMAPYQGGWLFASESCALDLFRVSGTPVAQGELIELSASGKNSWSFGDRSRLRQCSFEHIYFARPDSNVYGRSVYRVRVTLGKILARKVRVPDAARERSIVIAVPDSSNIEALYFARETGLPFEFGLIRNHYMGRTFITPEQEARELGVRMKLNAVEAVVADRSIYVVDDSLVRGTTGRKVASLLREAGAREVHMCISSPPVKHPCHWGIDTPERKQLIAAEATTEEIARSMGVDSLTYLSVDELHEALEDPDGTHHCTSCFTTVRPVTGQLLPPEHLIRPPSH